MARPQATVAPVAPKSEGAEPGGQPIKLKIFQLRGSKLPKADSKHYAEIAVDGVKQTTARCCGGEWGQDFSFETRLTSLVKIDVYAPRKVLGPRRLGSLQMGVQSLHELVNGLKGPQRVTQELSGGKGSVEFHVDIEDIDIMTALPSGRPLMLHTQSDSSELHPLTIAAFDRAATISSNVAPTATSLISASEACMPFLERFQAFCGIVDSIASVHPYTAMAWGLLTVLPKILQGQIELDKHLTKLFNALFSFYDIVNDLEVETIDALEAKSDLLARITSQTMECHHFIVAYWRPQGIFSRAAHNLLKPTHDVVADFEFNLSLLKDEFYGRIASSTNVTVARILDAVEDLRQESNLDDVSYTRGARFDDTKLCLPGTRKVILQDIADWVHREGDERVLWLTGGLGTGKSAIAHTIAHRFHFLQRLGSSFFLVRGQAGHEPSMIFSTIARDLADLDQGYREKLWEMVRRDRSLRTTANALVQFENFLAKPCSSLTVNGPIVIVIDALDECGDAKSRRSILEVLSTRVRDLPNNIRFIVTSRAEADIEASLTRSSYVCIKRMDNIPPSSTERDIQLFFTQRLVDFPVDLDLLTNKSEGNFQWAFVASEYIAEEQLGLTWDERYRAVVESNSTGTTGPLDSLYEQVLEQLFSPQSNPIILSRFRLVMAIMLTALIPLSAQAVDAMLPHLPLHRPVRPDLPAPFSTHAITKFMGSLLSGAVEPSTPFRARHASFKDFLAGSSTSHNHRFIVDLNTMHDDISTASLAIMKRELRFNICSLESSYHPNKAVLDLPARVSKCVPGHLSYACLFWAEHLHKSSPDSATYKEVLAFFRERLLFWLEVISVSDSVDKLPDVVAQVLAWSDDAVYDSENLVNAFANDLQRYVSAYATVIAYSAPHIYLSLPFLPKRSIISQCYLPAVQRSVNVASRATVEWPLVESVLRGHAEPVFAVSVSPNSARVASCSGDGTVRYWDAATGSPVGEPFDGHDKRSVNDVSFSPCGRFIASAGSDGTVRFWDTGTCQEIGEPLVGHNGPVLAIAFHPNGRTIASASYDESIRLWDIFTRFPILPPLLGHTMAISSLTFSPDGSYFVSGSYDETVRFWKTDTGQPLRDPLRAHCLPITSVRISPDGLQMATTSYEDKLRLWDTTTWACIGEPIRGHDDFAICAAFSPDSHQVATNTDHEALRVFDTSTCLPVGQTVRGHEGAVISIAFSPDGSRIVSGSSDTTVRLWQPVKAEKANKAATVIGHTGSVNAIAFSADGSRVVSGSFDETVRLWDVETGMQIGPPLRGHSKPIMSVAYSPDGSYVASASYDKSIRLWRVTAASAKLDKVLRGHDGGVNAICFSTSSTRLISGSDDGTIRIWNVSNGEVAVPPSRGHTKDITAIAMSPDGTLVASGAKDCTIRFWDVDSGAAVGDDLIENSPCSCLCFSADSTQLAAGYSGGEIILWDIQSRTVIAAPTSPHTLGICSVALSPDGTRMASSSWDRSVYITALSGYGHSVALIGHQASVFSLAFARDGKTLGTGSYDHSIRLWDVDLRTGENPSPILLSRTAAHALTDADGLFSNTPDGCDRRDLVRLMDDGWIVGPDNVLLFWIPPEHRARMWTPRTRGVLGEDLVQVDLSSFAHGPRWEECFSGSSR